jgi:hypothetical protein
MNMATRNNQIDTTPRPTTSRAKPPAWRTALAERIDDQWEIVREAGADRREHLSANVSYVLADAVQFLAELPANSIHAVVTDPPYGVIEYENKDHQKLRSGRGGVWRIPPSFDGAKRSPLPRFTVLTDDELTKLHSFFSAIAYGIQRALVPGGHAFIAANPLLSTMTFHAFQSSGLEKRGEVIRLVSTLRGGDRPKGSEKEFSDVSVMARSGWEPWGIFRKPMIGTAAANLRAYGTGGLRRIGPDEPFRDVITCSPTRGREREIAPHPSLKPQRFMRQLVRASLPLGVGIIYDPFAGSGSTLAAAEANGYRAIGTDRDLEYFAMGTRAFGPLSKVVLDQ